LETGTIFDFQRFSIHDGPGIRTIVFLKGCDLRCPWCSNPEGLNPWPEMLWREEKCINCGKCVKACLYGASRYDEGRLSFDRAACKNCGACAKECPSEARENVGRVMRADEVVQEALADKPFFDTSGGGVTLSGGEVLKQAAFVRKILKLCKAERINTAVETSGYGKWELLKSIAKHTDLFLYDFKHHDTIAHKNLTGVNNNLILENLKRLLKLGNKVILRVPVIPSFNDSHENMNALKEMIKELPEISEVHLLPYHRLGTGKYESLSLEYSLKNISPLEPKDLEDYCELLEDSGARVKVLW
jgi:pyruvate formate lyase activating enzyme